jgi:hypothetical protein
MSFVPKTIKKGGNNLTTDLANLSVPFGLILAQKSLEKYLTVNKTPVITKKNSKAIVSGKKATVSGGMKHDKATVSGGMKHDKATVSGGMKQKQKKKTVSSGMKHEKK